MQVYDKTTKRLYSCAITSAKKEKDAFVIATVPAARRSGPVPGPAGGPAGGPVGGPAGRAPKRKRSPPKNMYNEIASLYKSYLDEPDTDDSAKPQTIKSTCVGPYLHQVTVDGVSRPSRLIRPTNLSFRNSHGEPTNLLGQPGRGPYRVVENSEDIARLLGISKGRIKIKRDGLDCYPTYVLLDPRQWNVIGMPNDTSPTNILDVGPLMEEPQYHQQTHYRFTENVVDRDGHMFSNVLVMPPNYKAVSKIIPANTVFTCQVNSRRYTINVLRKMNGLDTQDKRYLSLRFGTQTADESPFQAFARSSDCMEIRFDLKTKSCDIHYLQLKPVFELKDYYDSSGTLLVEKDTLYNSIDNWKHCAQPYDPSRRTGCTTDIDLLRANKKKELSELRNDFQAKTWLEIARQFVLYVGLTSYISLLDDAKTSWPKQGPERLPTSEYFSYLCFSHYTIGRKGLTLYESYIRDLRPRDNPEVHDWVKQHLKTKKFKDLHPEFQLSFREMHRRVNNVEVNFNEMYIHDTPETPGIVSQFGTMVSLHGKDVLTFILDYETKIKSILESRGIDKIYACSYYMWYGLIMSVKEPYTNLPLVNDPVRGPLNEDQIRKSIEHYDPHLKIYYVNNLNSKISNVHWIDWAPCWA